MWLKPQGYAIVCDPVEGNREADTLTCFHCNRVVHVRAKAAPEDVGGFCRMCMKPICASCVDGPCVPFEKKLEQIEAQYHARRSYE